MELKYRLDANNENKEKRKKVHLRAVPEIILGGAQTVFCPVGGRVFLLTVCPRGGGGGE